MVKHCLKFAALAMVLQGWAVPQLPGAGGAAQAADLEAQVQQILSGEDLGQTEVAVMVVDLRSGRTLVEINADQPLVPASNMKLLTTAAATARLGIDFKFTTRLSLLRPPPGSALAPGNVESAASSYVSGGSAASALPSLVIIGEGDPGFGDPALLAQSGLEVDDLVNLWVEAVEATGEKRFARLLLDDRIFDREFTHPAWPADQLNRWYCAQVAGLNFHDNVLAVLPIPAAQKGQAPTIQLYPYYPSLKTANRATTGDSDIFDIQRRPGTNDFTFHGSMRNRPGAPFRVTVHDPGMFFGRFLQHKLRQAGIRVDEVERLGRDEMLDARRLTTLHSISTTLPGVINRTNQDSQNMFAEALFKRLGHQLTGESGGFGNGAAAIRVFLNDHLAGRVGLAAVRVDDGSGMSPHNRLTARILAELLRFMHDEADLGPMYIASLAHAGHNGTLRRRLTDLHGDVYAKSGYLGASADYASSLSGYLVQPTLTAAPDRPRVYAFSMLFNGFRPPLSNVRMKGLQDKVLLMLDEELSGAAVR